MKKALIAVGAVVGAFALGMAGVYFAMPMVSPQMVEKAQIRLDSLAVADSLAIIADSLGVSPDSLMAMLPEPVAEAESAPVDTTNTNEGAAKEPEETAALEVAIEDSLATLQQSIEALLQEKEAMLNQLKTLQEQSQTQKTAQAVAQELSATLAKLEDKELAGVVEQLDMAVLKILYKQASARNRTRLLQAMPPAVAATFVQSLVQPGRAAASSPPDTTSSTGVAGSNPSSSNE